MKKYLDKKTEAELISLGNRKYYQTLVLTIVWISFILILSDCYVRT